MSNVEARVDALQRRVVAVEQRAERMEESFSPTGHYGLLITRHDKLLYVYSALATVAVMFAAGALGWLLSSVYELKGDVASLRTSMTGVERRLEQLETKMDARMQDLAAEMKQLSAALRADLGLPSAGSRKGAAAPLSLSPRRSPSGSAPPPRPRSRAR